jgi:hypothetical protein
MQLAEQVQAILYAGGESNSRFTQDGPILADVWVELVLNDEADVLITPTNEFGAHSLFSVLKKRWPGEKELARNESHVVATITFQDTPTLLALSNWWRLRVASEESFDTEGLHSTTQGPGFIDAVREAIEQSRLCQPHLDRFCSVASTSDTPLNPASFAGHRASPRNSRRRS